MKKGKCILSLLLCLMILISVAPSAYLLGNENPVKAALNEETAVSWNATFTNLSDTSAMATDETHLFLIVENENGEKTITDQRLEWSGDSLAPGESRTFTGVSNEGFPIGLTGEVKNTNAETAIAWEYRFVAGVTSKCWYEEQEIIANGQLSLADYCITSPKWTFDYTEKSGAVHHKGDIITTKADFIKNNTLSLLYSGEGLNTLFESIYADVGSEVFNRSFWNGGATAVCLSSEEGFYLYEQGIPSMLGRIIPLEPNMFKSYYFSGDNEDITWYKILDGSLLPYSYNHILSSISAAKTFGVNYNSGEVAAWSGRILGKHFRDISFWSVPDTANITGTIATVPAQLSASPWPSNGTIVNSFTVDTVEDVFDWSFMRNDPQETWQLNANQPESLYSALAACFCGYASVIHAALNSDSDFSENMCNLPLGPVGPVGGLDETTATIKNANQSAIFYTKFLKPLYEALGIENYPSLNQLVEDAAIDKTGNGVYAFSVNYGQTLFQHIMEPIIDWVENVLFADPVTVLSSVAPAVYNLFQFKNTNSFLSDAMVAILFNAGSYQTTALELSYKDVFAKLFDNMKLTASLREYLQPENQCINGHTWNDGNTEIVATCSATGVKTYTCTVCNATKTETIPVNASNHVNTTNVAATASTCTVKGYTAGVYCNDCKQYISGHAEQPLAQHTLTTQNAKAATCTAEGYTGDQVCTVCNQTITSGTAIAKKAHTLTTVNQKAATCTAEGYTGDQVCTTCNQTITSGTAIAKKAHTLTTVNQKAATCTAEGYTGDQVCATCNQTITSGTAIAKKAHTLTTQNAKAATCTAEGYTGDQVCTVCKQTITKGTAIAKKAHTLTTVNKAEANCTTAGYTGDQYCTTCKQTVTKGSAVAALGHANADSNGNCTRCGTHIKDVTPSQPSNPQPNPNACKYCGQVHTGPFGWLIKFFHSILAIFKR